MNNTIITLNFNEIEKTKTFFAQNSNVLRIDDNLFTVKRITTLLKPFYNYNDDKSIMSETFGFSYLDPNIKELIFVNLSYNPTSFFEYIKNSGQLSDAQLNELKAKADEYVSHLNDVNFTEENDVEEFGSADANLDKITFNEALVFMLAGINHDDCERIKNDTWDKFLNWRKKMLEINNTNHNSFIELYNMLLDSKMIS